MCTGLKSNMGIIVRMISDSSEDLMRRDVYLLTHFITNGR